MSAMQCGGCATGTAFAVGLTKEARFPITIYRHLKHRDADIPRYFENKSARNIGT